MARSKNQGGLVHFNLYNILTLKVDFYVYIACCWAFSTTGAIEGIHKIVTNKLVSLSEQQLVSCSKLDDNNGRKGVHTALQYVMDNRGIAKEEDYPYKAIYGTCDPNLVCTMLHMHA